MVKKHITLVISSLGPGGAEKVLSRLANFFDSKNWNVTILTVIGNNRPFYPLRKSIKVINLNLKPEGDATFPLRTFRVGYRLIKLRSAIIKAQADVIVSFISSVNIIVLLATLGLRKKIIVSDRTGIYQGQRFTMFKYLVYRLANKIVVQTSRNKLLFPANLQQKVVVIPNPVTKIITNSESNVVLRKPCIVGLGRLSHEKGFDILIKAFSQIHNLHPSWSLYIVGDGPDMSNLQELIHKFKIKHKVQLLGIQSNSSQILKQADIFVLPSLNEGFPNALCEAMSLGIPSIASDCFTGPREIIREGYDGLLFKPGSVKQLVNKIELLINQPKFRKKLGQNAKQVIQRFDEKEIMNHWLSLID